MVSRMLQSVIFTAIILAPAIAWKPYNKCDMDFKKVGCYVERGDDRVLQNELLNERDKNNNNFDGHKIDWKNFTGYLSGLACRCAAKSREEGFGHFGLQFYGECWSGDGVYFKYGKANANKCISDMHANPCDDSNDDVCVGKQFTNYVYMLVNKRVDGGYTDWSEWSTCTKTCGGGVQKRFRTCNNPNPSGEGKDCSAIGPAKESKVCNTKECDVHGGYSEWYKWSECTKSCGGGTQLRRRTCSKPFPSENGRNCSGLGPDSETKVCNTQECVEPCEGDNYPFQPVPCHKILDVGVLLDGSGSIKKHNFELAKDSIVELAKYLKISPKGSHMGLVVYSTATDVIFHFQDNQRLQAITTMIKDVKYPGKRTHTSEAINKANKQLFRSRGNRLAVPNVLLVFTDGSNTNGRKKLRIAVHRLSKNVKTIAVGIGPRASKAELMIIASYKEDNVILVKDFDKLKEKLGLILKHSC